VCTADSSSSSFSTYNSTCMNKHSVVQKLFDSLISNEIKITISFIKN
jgi:hypothetical protein